MVLDLYSPFELVVPSSRVWFLGLINSNFAFGIGFKVLRFNNFKSNFELLELATIPISESIIVFSALA